MRFSVYVHGAVYTDQAVRITGNYCQIMGNHNYSHVLFFLQMLQQVKKLVLGGEVQPGVWFIQKQQLWLAAECPRKEGRCCCPRKGRQKACLAGEAAQLSPGCSVLFPAVPG